MSVPNGTTPERVYRFSLIPGLNPTSRITSFHPSRVALVHGPGPHTDSFSETHTTTTTTLLLPPWHAMGFWFWVIHPQSIKASWVHNQITISGTPPNGASVARFVPNLCHPCASCINLWRILPPAPGDVGAFTSGKAVTAWEEKRWEG